MTYLEKAKEMQPYFPEDIIVDEYCPFAFIFDLGYVNCETTCSECWNREMPEEEG